jgi:hypothetical protein
MRDHNIIWKFNTARFSVVLFWTWEDYPDLSWDDTGETQKKCESGEWGVYTFGVEVCCDGRRVAIDYLGNSIYADPKEFYQEHFGIRKFARDNGGNYGCYFSDMVSVAIGEARKALCNAPKLRCA